MPLALGWALLRREETDQRKRVAALNKILGRVGKKRGPWGVVDLGIVPFLDRL